MNDIELMNLTVIATTLIIGIALGFSICLFTIVRENRILQKELNKFRDLYFEEMDKWRTKYDQNDYEAY